MGSAVNQWSRKEGTRGVPVTGRSPIMKRSWKSCFDFQDVSRDFISNAILETSQLDRYASSGGTLIVRKGLNVQSGAFVECRDRQWPWWFSFRGPETTFKCETMAYAFTHRSLDA